MLYAKNYSLYDYNNINDFNLVKEYLDCNSSYKSETSIITYKSSLKIFYKFFTSLLKENNANIKDCLAKSIDRKTIEYFINYQIQNKLSEDVVITRVAAVKDYLKYLAKNKVITKQKFFDVFDDLKMPKRKIKSQICIKSNEAMRLIEILKKQKDTFVNRRNILTVLLMSNTGIRRKEIALINPNAINFENNTIMIYKTKGSKPRIIGFSECVKSIMINYLKDREYILKKYNKKSDNLLIKTNGDNLLVNSISDALFKYEKKYNFKITCHSLRRGFATDMAENKTDIYLLSKIMGHESINTTVSRYIQVLSGAIKEAMNNHPFSKLQSSFTFSSGVWTLSALAPTVSQAPEIEKDKMQDTVNKDELISTINLLSQEINRLSKMLEKKA